jgi:exo-beta-1,3-glucanase (GH17 family)
MALLLASLLTLTAASPLSRANAPNCFPYGSATLNTDYSPPSASRADWWCPQSLAYGFQGFSYPLESSDCSDASNGFDAMNADFARMKADFGASIVRAYYPACTDSSVFLNLLKAGVANNMAVIPQIWFDFGDDNSVWPASQQALYDVMNDPTYGPIAPYVFHSADFGSEPIGDGVDGGPDQFVRDLASFKQTMNGYGVPVGISEDWDRPGTMSGSDGTGLASTGQAVKDNSDFVHAHVMPFYHGNLDENQTWDYISGQLQWLNSTVGLPTMVTETQWAWGPNEHYSNHVDVGVDQYTAYWKKWDDECEMLKGLNVAWFLHAWNGEGTFDIMYDDGSYVIPSWKPKKC